MGKSGIALKALQWFIRGVQFCCCAVVLGLFSYFLARLHMHGAGIPTWTRAVEGISGAGVLYTLIGLLLLCCLAGRIVTSFIAIVLDIAFIGAFVYVAQANRVGAGSCHGTVNTAVGEGNEYDYPVGSNGNAFSPTYGQACKTQTAVFAVSIIAIFFFLLSILMELALVRNHRKEKRYGPSPANNYTSGTSGGFMSRFRRRGTANSHANTLPAHTTPDQVRPSYNTETTAVGHDTAFNKHGEAGLHNGTQPHVAGEHHTGVTGTQPAAYRYNDGTYNA